MLRDLYVVRDAYAVEHGHDLDRIYADLKRREALGQPQARESERGCPCSPLVSAAATTVHNRLSKNSNLS